MCAYHALLIVFSIAEVLSYSGIWEFQNYCGANLTNFCSSSNTNFPVCAPSVSLGSPCTGADRNNLDSCYFAGTNIATRCIPIGTEYVWHVNNVCEDDMGVNCLTDFGVGFAACPSNVGSYGYAGFPCTTPNDRCKSGKKIFSCIPQSSTRFYYNGVVAPYAYPACPDYTVLPSELFFPGGVQNGVTGMRCNSPGQLCTTISFTPLKHKLWQCHRSDAWTCVGSQDCISYGYTPTSSVGSIGAVELHVISQNNAITVPGASSGCSLVEIRRSPTKDIILLLQSLQPTHWIISVTGTANIRAVYLAGTGQTISGTGAQVNIVQYSTTLQQSAQSITGFPVTTYTQCYKSTSWIIANDDVGNLNGGPSACPAYLCSSNCNGHGTCVGSELCTCQAGWTGSDCGTPICFGESGEYACSGNGECIDMDVCQCYEGWSGPHCDVQQQVTTGIRLTSGRLTSGSLTTGSATTGHVVRGGTTGQFIIPVSTGEPLHSSSSSSSSSTSSSNLSPCYQTCLSMCENSGGVKKCECSSDFSQAQVIDVWEVK